jgi:two-component system, response regulator YesN
MFSLKVISGWFWMRRKGRMNGELFSDRVVTYILNCSLEELRDTSINDIADYFGITKMTLITKFKTQKGITPGKFIAREKMHRALVLMANNRQLTICKLTEKMGFSTSDYFIRLFKEYFGTSPGRYRDALNRDDK